MSVKRFGVSIENELAENFDSYIAERGYENRSEAIRDLIRAALAERQLENPEAPAVAALAIVFDHGKHLNHRLVHEQHKHIDEIISSLHVHMDEERCLEVVVLRGTSGRISKIADKLISIRGVLRGEIILKAPA
ncbi:nickel-responsive transcriptional regulator NikR [bacterium]|nr:MAG: nickel-responsive transcriptional regulator NikR [bacterium]